jgi:hypothetical protein
LSVAVLRVLIKLDDLRHQITVLDEVERDDIDGHARLHPLDITIGIATIVGDKIPLRVLLHVVRILGTLFGNV